MIADPRQYTQDYPKSNMLIDTAIRVSAAEAAPESLDAAMADMLKRENDALINVALNLAPGVSVCRIVWDSLNRVINKDKDNHYANIFAIPVVLVAGSKTRIRLKERLDTDKLNDFFMANALFNPGADAFISGKLIEPQKIAAIRPSQMYYWVRNLQQAKLWLPVEMEGSSIEVLNEGVFLRFLVGVTIDQPGNSGLNIANCNNSLMELMRYIHSELNLEGVTLFPIPLAPVELSRAYVTGTEYRTEIAVSVAVSNIVKKIREQQLTPIATLSTADEQLRIDISSSEASDFRETSLCSMTRFADFGQLLQNISNLLSDVGVEIRYANPVA